MTERDWDAVLSVNLKGLDITLKLIGYIRADLKNIGVDDACTGPDFTALPGS